MWHLKLCVYLAVCISSVTYSAAKATLALANKKAVTDCCWQDVTGSIVCHVWAVAVMTAAET